MIVEITNEKENLSNTESILKEEDEASDLEKSLDVKIFTHESIDESSNDVSAITSSSWQDSENNDQYSYWTLDNDNLMVELPNEAKSITESLLKKEEEEYSNPENVTKSYCDFSLDMESFTPDSGYENDEEDASNDMFSKLSSSWQFQYVTHL